MTAPVEDPRLKSLDVLVAYLAARHAEDQQNVSVALAAALFPLWNLMELRSLDSSTVRWVTVALERVETAYLQSQRLAAVFNASVRFASLSTAPPLILESPQAQVPSVPISPGAFVMPDLVETPLTVRLPAVIDSASPQWVLDRVEDLAGESTQQTVELQRFDAGDVAKTLTIEANYRTKKQLPGDEVELMQAALVRSSGGAIREAMNGGRGVTARVVDLDRKVLGYARVTDSDPCPFCALLAARGGVYGRPSFIASNRKFDEQDREQAKLLGIPMKAPKDLPFGWSDVAKVHNHCACTLRPVYTKSQSQDAGAKHFEKLWKEDLTDKSGSLAQTMKRYGELLKANPLPQSQWDMYTMGKDLEGRVDGLLDAGFSSEAPQVKFATGMKKRLEVRSAPQLPPRQRLML